MSPMLKVYGPKMVTRLGSQPFSSVIPWRGYAFSNEGRGGEGERGGERE